MCLALPSLTHTTHLFHFMVSVVMLSSDFHFSIYLFCFANKRGDVRRKAENFSSRMPVKSHWSITFVCLWLYLCLSMFICLFFCMLELKHCSQFMLFMQWILFAHNVGKLILHSISIPGKSAKNNQFNTNPHPHLHLHLHLQIQCPFVLFDAAVLFAFWFCLLFEWNVCAF